MERNGERRSRRSALGARRRRKGGGGAGNGTRPLLRVLADRVGILAEYVDQTGTETRVTSDATRVALLRAMGIDASTEGKARLALDRLDREEEARLLPVVRVVRESETRSRSRVVVRVPLDWTAPVRWAVETRSESGEVHRVDGSGRPRGAARALTLPLPDEMAPAPLGYHTVRVTLEHVAAGEDGATPEARSAEQTLIVVPARCPTPATVLGGRRVFGVIANLYTVWSARSWGIGDAGDLAALAEWSAGCGAAFVGVNPLHALLDREGDISPYSPVSRVFRNAIYIDVEQVPELARSPEARARLAGDEVRNALALARESERVLYEEVWLAKRTVLEALHRTFAAHERGTGSARGTAYEEFLDRFGPMLDDFATFMAIDEARQRHDEDAPPMPLPPPDSAPIRAWRAAHAEAVDFHRWLQFELDRQLAAAAERARRAGLALGLYQDLAIGTNPNGSDVWAWPGLFVRGASIGAPPDEYSRTGQQWGLPPIDPRALREQRYAYWIALLRSAFRHGGALRIDHAMGLFRLFWIPEGKQGKDGAYVRYPADDLLGILALEATRAGAVVVGEDLGTVPPEVPPALRRWGVLSSRVLYFERDREGRFRPASRYPAEALATANTHDMPTLAGWWEGRDIALRRELGLIPSDRAARARREREKRFLLERLRQAGVIASVSHPPEGAALRGAIHRFLCRTPSALVGVMLDDLVGELTPVNVPGVGPDRYPSWSRRMHESLDAIPADPAVRAALPDERR